jgi:hypothetical protein
MYRAARRGRTRVFAVSQHVRDKIVEFAGVWLARRQDRVGLGDRSGAAMDLQPHVVAGAIVEVTRSSPPAPTVADKLLQSARLRFR